MDEHDDALKVFQRALKLRQDELDDMFIGDDVDESNLKVAKVLNNIGCVYFEKSELELASQAFDSAIAKQQSVFRNWYTFVCGLDMKSPGVLTMASTMCNKGYVVIEQNKYLEAIQIFEESLKIQKAILGAENKLVQSTLDNIGYAHVMLGKYDKALKIYEEIWASQLNSNDKTEDKAETLRKVVICHARMEQWSKTFEKLEPLDDIYRELYDIDSKEQRDIQKLMGEVNYQILKLPSLSEATNTALGCAVCSSSGEEKVNLDRWIIEKPGNTSKMSGHRITHA
jgi:tetratricopeptide (TPR) repeat protein